MSKNSDALFNALSMNEIERLIPGAMAALREEIASPAALRRPPNPVKVDEYLKLEQTRFERQAERLSDLLAAWLKFKMMLIQP